MSRRIWMLAVGVVAVGATVAAAVVGPTAAGGQKGPIELEIRLSDARSVILDFNRNGRINRGERAVDRAPLRDPATGDRVGRAFLDCIAATRIVPLRSGTWVCSYVLRLSEGHIILEGEDPAGEGPNVLAVTGGTGVYRDARGQVDQMDFPDRSTYTIHLEP